MTDTPIYAAPGAVVETHPEGISISLADGSALVVPWTVSWALEHAPAPQRYVCQFTPDRTAVMWPRLWVTVRISHLYELAMVEGGPVLLPSAATRSAA